MFTKPSCDYLQSTFYKRTAGVVLQSTLLFCGSVLENFRTPKNTMIKVIGNIFLEISETTHPRYLLCVR